MSPTPAGVERDGTEVPSLSGSPEDEHPDDCLYCASGEAMRHNYEPPRDRTEEKPRPFPGTVVWTGATGWVEDPPICRTCGENGHPVETITDMFVWHHVDADLEDEHDFSAVDGRATVIFDPEKMTQPIPDDFEVRPIEDRGEPGTATCGYCDLSWNDDLSTGLTPVPSGRCPFEYFHRYPDDETGDENPAGEAEGLRSVADINTVGELRAFLSDLGDNLEVRIVKRPGENPRQVRYVEVTEGRVHVVGY